MRSNSLENEIDEWVDLLIEVLEKNKPQIKQLKGPIWALGYTNSLKARYYLKDLFIQYSNQDVNFSEIIAYSLSNNPDKEVINLIFNTYYSKIEFRNFGSELTLSAISNKNLPIIEQLFSEKNNDYLINYVRAIRYLNNPTNIDELINNCKELLKNEIEGIRFEAIKTIHKLLPYEEETLIFREHLGREKSQRVKNEIFFFIGRQ